MRDRTIIYGLLCCTLLLLSACGPAASLTPVATPDTGSYQPIDASECTELQDIIAETLGVEVMKGTGPFEDYAVGGRGTGCLLQATGTGVDFPSAIGLVSDLQFLFEDMEWVLDIRYAASGSDGTAFALRKDNRLLLVGVMWAPANQADCPAGTPIKDCHLSPEQIQYTITVRGAQK